MCVAFSKLYRDTARRHKAPLYMLRREHYKLTQKPLCLQAWGEGGGGGLAGAGLPRFGLDTQLTHHLVHLAGQLHVSSHSIFRDFPFLHPKYCVGWAEVLFSLACVRARQIKHTRQRCFSGSSSPVGMAAERWQCCAAMSRGLQAVQLSLEIQHDTSAGRPLSRAVTHSPCTH